MAKARQIAFDFDFSVPAEPEQPVNEPVADVDVETAVTTLPETAQEATAETAGNSLLAALEAAREQAAVEVTGVQPPEPNGKKGIRGRRSIRELELQAVLVEVPPDEELFSKQYYAMNEVASMFHVNHSLLRYWESEFDILKPRKNRKGDRHFRPEDIKNLQIIHYLLRQKKLTIDGARDYLKHKKKTDQRFAAIQSLERLKGFLLELKAGL